jgi:hypothetical protein
MMMRRLLVLMLVLGMTSVASAATVAVYTNVTQGVDALSPPAGKEAADGDTIEIVVSTDAQSAGGSTGFSFDVEWSTGGVATVLGTWSMTPIGSVVPYGANGESFILGDGFAGLPAPAGDWFKGVFQVPTGAVAGDGDLLIDVTFHGDLLGGKPADAQMPLVPEPMTIALLGLGGLFLRRRK